MQHPKIKDLLDLAIKSNCDGYSIWRAKRDRQNQIIDFELIYSSDASVDPTKMATAKLVHKLMNEVIMDGDAERVKSALRNALKAFETSGSKHRAQNIDGWMTNTESTIIPLTKDEVLITYVNKSQAKIIHNNHWISDHDPLTGLINQVLLDELISQALMQLQLHSEPFAFGIIDLDDFKNLNKNFGVALGDQVLRNFSELLKDKLRKSDRIIRLSEDDFAVVLRDTHDISEITALSKNLMHGAARGWRINGEHISLNFSAGFVLVGDYHVEPREIFHLAQEQMFKVKNQGKNGAISTILHGMVAN